MNFSKVLYDSVEAGKALKKLEEKSKSLMTTYSSLKEPSEESITSNFFGITKCNQVLSDLKTLSLVLKDTKKFSEIESNLNQTLDTIKSNLNDIAIELEPEEYVNDLKNIIQVLNDKNIAVLKETHFIFPKGSQIIIGTTMDCGEKDIVFTTIYTDTNLEKYLNLIEEPFDLDKYSFGIPFNNITEDLNNLIEDSSSVKIDNLIKNSTIFDNYIKASVKERLNIKKTFQVLTDYFADKLDKSYLHESDLLFRFKSGLTDKEVQTISKILKLNNNDKYKFMALLKE